MFCILWCARVCSHFGANGGVERCAVYAAPRTAPYGTFVRISHCSVAHKPNNAENASVCPKRNLPQTEPIADRITGKGQVFGLVVCAAAGAVQ